MDTITLSHLPKYDKKLQGAGCKLQVVRELTETWNLKQAYSASWRIRLAKPEISKW